MEGGRERERERGRESKTEKESESDRERKRERERERERERGRPEHPAIEGAEEVAHVPRRTLRGPFHLIRRPNPLN